MDFSSLEPLRHPGHGLRVTGRTLTVGHNTTPTVQDLLTGFEKSFAASDTAADSIALVVATSGSTGVPKQTALTVSALKASARATERFTSTHNAQWLLALPTRYIAGAQVLARSVLAGTTPAITRSVVDSCSFNAADFLRASERLTARHRMVSLVPAQLTALLEAAAILPEILPALRSFHGVLLGGAPASSSLLERARQEDIVLFHTYGSAETSGGCIYNGLPLPGVQVYCEPDETPDRPGPGGRVWLSGPQLASGYLNSPEKTAKHFFTDGRGSLWYRSDDLGFRSAGRLTITGRVDDLIITGGLKLSPAPIASRLEEHPGVREAFVCGLPHPRWGSTVAAAIHMEAGASPAVLARQLKPVINALETAQRPRTILYLKDFPRLATGKPDRQRLKELLSSQAGIGGEPTDL